MVRFDDAGIFFESAEGPPSSIRFDQLSRVTIATTDEGPFVDGIFWILTDAKGEKLTVPSETPGLKALIGRLAQLPGFDDNAVISAMSSTDHAEFVCWERQTE